MSKSKSGGKIRDFLSYQTLTFLCLQRMTDCGGADALCSALSTRARFPARSVKILFFWSENFDILFARVIPARSSPARVARAAAAAAAPGSLVYARRQRPAKAPRARARRWRNPSRSCRFVTQSVQKSGLAPSTPYPSGTRSPHCIASATRARSGRVASAPPHRAPPRRAPPRRNARSAPRRRSASDLPHAHAPVAGAVGAAGALSRSRRRARPRWRQSGRPPSPSP